jgi:hypothetical protein
MVLNSSFLSGYYDGYVSQVWQLYSSATLTVDTQASFGTVTGQVSAGVLTFPGAGPFAKPTTGDIFSCSTGPFAAAGRATRCSRSSRGLPPPSTVPPCSSTPTRRAPSQAASLRC